jgi:hypothetical protein
MPKLFGISAGFDSEVSDYIERNMSETYQILKIVSKYDHHELVQFFDFI